MILIVNSKVKTKNLDQILIYLLYYNLSYSFIVFNFVIFLQIVQEFLALGESVFLLRKILYFY